MGRIVFTALAFALAAINSAAALGDNGTVEKSDLDRGYVPLSFVDAAAGPVTAETAIGPRIVASSPAPEQLGPAGIALPELDAAYVAPALVHAEAGIAAHEIALHVDRLPSLIAALSVDSEFRARVAQDIHLAEVVRFYAAAGHAPLWIERQGLTGQGRAVAARLARAAEDGLDPGDYAKPAARLAVAQPITARELAQAELELSLAVVRYARHAQGGRIEPSSLGSNVTAKPTRPKPRDVLSGISTAADPVAFLEAFHPRHPAFAALREKLAELRTGQPAEQPERIGDGALIRPGNSDPRVPALRRRLDVEQADRPMLYDPGLVAAVKSFQEATGLVADGIVGPATLRAINSARDVTVADVLVNMERWRWLPPDMGGKHYVWVNLPEYRLRVVSGEEAIFETRVIVGRRDRQTPIFSDEIEYLEVNPYWHVPQSIAARDLLPELQQDPMSLYRRGIQVFYTGGGRQQEIDPRAVDWRQWQGRSLPFHFRQVPSEVNALGRVKFMFPNQHAVYLHDTPTRSLFNRSERMFSSGCVRVEHPVAFADAMLALEADLNGPRVESLINQGRNGTVNLKRRVPVHLTYFTVWLDDSGEVQLRDDIYGHDERLKELLGLTDPELSML